MNALVKSNYSNFPLSEEEIEAWARLLQAKHVEPKDVEQKNKFTWEDFKDVIIMAISDGYNPLSKTFYYWKHEGAILFMEKYTHLVNWAQMKRPFTAPHKFYQPGHELRSIDASPRDLFCEVFLIFNSDKESIRQEVKSRLEFLKATTTFKSADEAMTFIDRVQDQVLRGMGSTGFGLLKASEIYFKNSSDQINYWRFKSGWTPERMCAKRGTTAAIKNVIGEPEPEERRQWSILAVEDARRYAHTIQSTGLQLPEQIEKVHALEDHANRYTEETAQLDKLREEHEGIEIVRSARRKRVSDRTEMMRGADSIHADPLAETPVSGSISEGEIVPDEPPADSSSGVFNTRKEDLVKVLMGTGIIRTRELIDKASEAMFGKTFADLDPLGESLMVAYAKRSALLNKNKGASIPEFRNGVPDDPKAALTTLVRDYYGKQKVMEEL